MVTQLLTSDALLDRLAICHLEITGIVKAWEKTPTEMIDAAMLPCVYLYQFGAMTEPTPAQSAGHADLTRRYVYRVLVVPVVTELQTGNVGSPGMNTAIPYVDLFAQYYLAHPRLNTDGTHQAALGGLSLVLDVLFQDGGVKPVAGPDGAAYWGFDETLTITQRVKVSRIS